MKIRSNRILVLAVLGGPGVTWSLSSSGPNSRKSFLSSGATSFLGGIMLVGGSVESCEAKENANKEIGSSNPRFIESELEMKYGETKGSFSYY
jgi:hypothetical protein